MKCAFRWHRSAFFFFSVSSQICSIGFYCMKASGLLWLIIAAWKFHFSGRRWRKFLHRPLSAWIKKASVHFIMPLMSTMSTWTHHKPHWLIQIFIYLFILLRSRILLFWRSVFITPVSWNCNVSMFALQSGAPMHIATSFNTWHVFFFFFCHCCVWVNIYSVQRIEVLFYPGPTWCVCNSTKVIKKRSNNNKLNKKGQEINHLS